MTLATPHDRWIDASVDTCEQVNALIAGPVIGRASWRPGRWKGWWILLACATPFALAFFVGLAVELSQGVGVFGNNTTLVWGFPIANYVWWIGIGNAGTLISALLLLTRQPWRASINRFAEAMTLFSVSIAGIFPIIHLGRPMFFYWMAPYPTSWDCGRSGGARWSGISGPSSPTCCSRWCSGT